MTKPPPLPDAIRASLPLEVQAYLTAVEAYLEAVETRLAELEARLKQNSHNSSRPPSSDPPSTPPRPQKLSRSERKRGGQPGHPGRHRALKAVADVDEVVAHRPRLCPTCQTCLPSDAVTVGEPVRQQVWDVPPIQPTVTEHQYLAVRCPCCDKLVRAERSVAVPPGAFGPRLTSLIGLLNGRYRLSKREVGDLVEAVFEVPISDGSVVNACEQVSAALVEPYAEAQTVVATAAHANVDETGWQEAGQRRWLWVAVTTVVSLFRLAATRRRAELSGLLGETYGGRITSDRFSAYAHLSPTRRQVCWAHLKRDLSALSQAPYRSGEWAERALAVEGQVFALWHRFRNGQIDRVSLLVFMQPLRDQFKALLVEGLTMPWYRTRGFCAAVLLLESALWTFLDIPAVEPTNNAAERALRPAVLWRKGAFGSDSADGLRFVERILTVTATCRQRSRPLLPFLTDAVSAHWAAQPAPSLFATA